MLEPGVIPNSEPLLRVGIVMPGDATGTLTLTIPPDEPCVVSADRNNPETVSGETLQFNLEDGRILLNNTVAAREWTISPAAVYPVRPAGGIRVAPVVAGRGFHWQKKISVFLPGTVIIRIYEDRLILINELPLEDYLMCVATSEMGQACPEALIAAQTIVARSWMLANIEQKHRNLSMDVCNDDCCQRYQGTANLNRHAIDAAGRTRGQVLLYQGGICDARYSKSCGGKMETFATIWGGPELPYLQNIPDFDRITPENTLDLSREENIRRWIDDIPDAFCSSNTVAEKQLKRYLGAVDEDGTYYRWNIRYRQPEITALLNQKLNLGASAILDLVALERGGSGRIEFLKIRYRDQQNRTGEFILERDVAIRGALHHGFLYSSCFYIETGRSQDGIPVEFKIAGAGWGHGVGLCQIGALGMALSGYPASGIVAHYYPGSSLETIYP